MKSVSGVRKDPDLAVLHVHNASAQQVTQNTVNANVLQNRTIFQLENTGSHQVMAYMGIVSALKILSALQRHIPHLCEHGYGHNFITNSNALMQLLTAPAPLSHQVIYLHTPLLSTLFNLIWKATLQQSSKVTPPRNPCMDKPKPSKVRWCWAVSAISFILARGVLMLRKNVGNIFTMIIPCCFYH